MWLPTIKTNVCIRKKCTKCWRESYFVEKENDYFRKKQFRDAKHGNDAFVTILIKSLFGVSRWGHIFYVCAYNIFLIFTNIILLLFDFISYYILSRGANVSRGQAYLYPSEGCFGDVTGPFRTHYPTNIPQNVSCENYSHSWGIFSKNHISSTSCIQKKT